MKRTLIMLYGAPHGEEERMVKAIAAAVSPRRRSRRHSLRKRPSGKRPLALEFHAMKGRIVAIAAHREEQVAQATQASSQAGRVKRKLEAWLAAEQAASFSGMHYSFYGSAEGELPALAGGHPCCDVRTWSRSRRNCS